MHTRPLAKELFSPGYEQRPPVLLVLDGTYIYIQKSCNFRFSRRSFSMHKHRPLVKPMMVVTTSGYVVSVLGPYLADSKNNDSGILNHMIRSNTEEMRDWLQDGDTFIVDRGFRDSSEVLGDIGVNMEMPCFLQRGTSQHTTQEANQSRLITKVRWVVESANARLKRWKYLNHVIPNTQIPFIGDYVRIVCALCNRFTSVLSSGNAEEDQAMTLKMLHLSKRTNELQEFVESNGLSNRTYSWQKIDAAGFAQDFPKLSDSEIRQLTLGVYQVKMAKAYTQEHLQDDGTYEILVNEDLDGIIGAKIQSRHVSSKKYSCWVKYEDGVVISWYCKCKAGARIVGSCGHITSVIWFLSHARHQDKPVQGVRDWSEHLEDAARVIDDSDSGEESSTEE
ncbi:uncharacterized protein LOC134281247 [Saccostrea cucullata]|uniref:uncharacterized protein LOC134281247 n=1 Tax=Saccostrea cuccullata TaxID=36930 RepID=UPI002ED6800A